MTTPDDGGGDFDFEMGRWAVRHRRLQDRLVGCTDWDSFTGTAEVRHVLGGQGNVEDNVLHLPTGVVRAIAIRSWDATSRSWSIWWLASDQPHRMDVPVVGAFTDGIGTFLAKDTLRGQPVLLRFLWLHTRTDTPRWEQAMSGDGGETWETNWTMDFERA